MARSKRNKIVSLTKTSSKGRELKVKLVDTIRSTLDEYKSVFLFSFENMRSEKFKEVRMHFRESRIYLGKNSIAQIALGRTPEEEYKDNLSKISEASGILSSSSSPPPPPPPPPFPLHPARLVGDVGLLFTNRPRKEVVSYFSSFEHLDFAKAGCVASEDLTLEPQALPQFPVSMLNELRKLGMAVEIEDGGVVLREPVSVMSVGQPLTPEQARMLVKLDRKVALFRIKLESMWSAKGCKIVSL
eukprot:gene24666-33137_t